MTYLVLKMLRWLAQLEFSNLVGKFLAGKTLNVGQKGLPPPLLLHCLKQSTWPDLTPAQTGTVRPSQPKKYKMFLVETFFCQRPPLSKKAGAPAVFLSCSQSLAWRVAPLVDGTTGTIGTFLPKSLHLYSGIFKMYEYCRAPRHIWINQGGRFVPMKYI